MRFIVDENVPPKIKHFLIEKGFDVVDVRDTGLEGKSDDQIMAYARQEKKATNTGRFHAGIRGRSESSNVGLVLTSVGFLAHQPRPSFLIPGLRKLRPE